MILPLLIAQLVAASNLTDEALNAKASAIIHAKDDSVPIDPVIGTHHGVKVILTSRCSDICPAYTVRIVHYDFEPGPACQAAGGIVEAIIVPAGIAAMRQNFCVPKVLSDSQTYVGHPYQEGGPRRTGGN